MNLKNQMTDQLIAEAMNVLDSESDQSYSIEASAQFEAAIYNDRLDQPLVKISALGLLSENIAILEDLTTRLNFTMRENRYLLNADEN